MRCITFYAFSESDFGLEALNLCGGIVPQGSIVDGLDNPNIVVVVDDDHDGVVIGPNDDKINAFLQEHEFEEIYRWVSEDRDKTLLAYTVQMNPNGDVVFDVEVASSRGGFFKVVLSAGGLYGRGGTGGESSGLPLPAKVGTCREGYLALKVRISLEYLAQNLAEAIFRNDGDSWLISEDLENVEGILNTLWLRFFPAVPDRDRGEPGEVTAASYRLLYVNPLNPSKATGKTAALYRTVFNGRRTFDEFLGQLKVRVGEDFLPLHQGALSSSFLEGNIVFFRVVFTILKPDEVGKVRPVRLGGLAGVEFPFARAAKSASADISLTDLLDHGARLYEVRNSGLDVRLTMDQILDRYGRIVSRRVPLLAEAM